jgi:hypothetical protein
MSPLPEPSASRPVIRRKPRSVAAMALAAVAVLALVGVARATPASASTLNAVATIADASTDAFLPSGASATQFTVTLPANAACSGDTATDGYHVYSYLVKKGTNLSTVTFIEAPSVGFGFVNNIGTYYGAANTAATTGQIIGIPNNFEWAPLLTNDGVKKGQLLYTGGTTGVWEAGLACANSSHVLTDNWNTQVTFTASSSDPHGFVWSAVPGKTGDSFAAITSAATATFTKGVAKTFTVTTTGVPKPKVTESGALPAGVTFTGTALKGTATVTGTFPITLTATNGIGNPAVQSFSLKVTPPPPKITTTSLPSGSPGVAYTPTTLKATGGTAPYKWSATGLPKGLTLGSGGVLKGTPAQTVTAGTYPIAIKATDSSVPVQTATATLNLTIN